MQATLSTNPEAFIDPTRPLSHRGVGPDRDRGSAYPQPQSPKSRTPSLPPHHKSHAYLCRGRRGCFCVPLGGCGVQGAHRAAGSVQGVRPAAHPLRPLGNNATARLVAWAGTCNRCQRSCCGWRLGWWAGAILKIDTGRLESKKKGALVEPRKGGAIEKESRGDLPIRSSPPRRRPRSSSSLEAPPGAEEQRKIDGGQLGRKEAPSTQGRRWHVGPLGAPTHTLRRRMAPLERGVNPKTAPLHVRVATSPHAPATSPPASLSGKRVFQSRRPSDFRPPGTGAIDAIRGPRIGLLICPF